MRALATADRAEPDPAPRASAPDRVASPPVAAQARLALVRVQQAKQVRPLPERAVAVVRVAAVQAAAAPELRGMLLVAAAPRVHPQLELVAVEVQRARAANPEAVLKLAAAGRQVGMQLAAAEKRATAVRQASRAKIAAQPAAVRRAATARFVTSSPMKIVAALTAAVSARTNPRSAMISTNRFAAATTARTRTFVTRTATALR